MRQDSVRNGFSPFNKIHELNCTYVIGPDSNKITPAYSLYKHSARFISVNLQKGKFKNQKLIFHNLLLKMCQNNNLFILLVNWKMFERFNYTSDLLTGMMHSLVVQEPIT